MEDIDFSEEQLLFIANEQKHIERDFKDNSKFKTKEIREIIEPWLTAVFQSEHLSLLIGTGLTNAISSMTKIDSTDMSRIDFKCNYKDSIKKFADEEAKNLDRGKANFEDDLRVATELLKGLKILGCKKEDEVLNGEINDKLTSFLEEILKNERDFINSEKYQEAIDTLKRFLISFSARASSRDRLNIFTTNYNRFIEYGLDESGILTLDRFIGKIKPIMRFHRVDLDYHYNPPGIRGEPRYVEGVVRFTKLHGSLDWRFNNTEIIREPISFGSAVGEFFPDPMYNVVIYPNSSKAIETAYFPYSELFRDFSTAICRPNSVLVTYGYGFGDSHINRIIEDMLTIPSTHIVIISYDNVDGRLEKIVKKINKSQLTLLIGNHLADLQVLTDNYLPKSAIDRITERKHNILEKRGENKKGDTNKTQGNPVETSKSTED
ncbi:MAG: SIR2 family protein [bacterium]